MGLITKTVKIKWNSKIKKHYEELGYTYTKMGDEFEVKIEDLTKGSHVRVYCICDNCGCDLSWNYGDYNKCVKENGETYCLKCGKILYGSYNSNKTKLKKSKSFYDWCVENDREDLLLRWDYELNVCSPNEVSYASNTFIWFKCLLHPEHHSEEKRIKDITSGHLKTSNCKQCNSVGQHIIDKYGKEFLYKIWSDKNEISPFDIELNSNIVCWWNCLDEKHEPFKRSCYSSKSLEYRCPNCYEPPKKENSPRWNPNLTQEEREQSRNIEGYNDFVRETLKRDNYTCQCCGHYSTNLITHHLNGYHWDKEHRTDINNGITLCKECHKNFHSLYGRKNNTKEQFEEWIKNKNIDK